MCVYVSKPIQNRSSHNNEKNYQLTPYYNIILYSHNINFTEVKAIIIIKY